MKSNESPLLSLIAKPIVFKRPWHISQPLAWVPHIPFAMWLTSILKPKLYVELGTHIGNSYFSICQTLKTLEIGGIAYAVDTWEGDSQAGYYGDTVFQRVSRINDEQFSSFSRLVRATFDEALPTFKDGSIDLLHIDGLHTYAAVKHDFETWLPKVSKGGVIIFHDTNVRENEFGVWKLWDEIKDLYPSLSFIHGHGLGVILVGNDHPSELKELIESSGDNSKIAIIREFFDYLGTTLAQAYESLPTSDLYANNKRSLAPSKRSQSFQNLDTPQSEINSLRAMLQSEQFFSNSLSIKLSSALSEISSMRNNEHQWIERFQKTVDKIRNTPEWRLHRAVVRFTTLVLRRKDEGPLGFLAWLFCQLVGKKYLLKNSFDSLEQLPKVTELIKPIAPSIESLVSVDNLNIQEKSVHIKSSPPVILKRAIEAPGEVQVVIPLKGSVHWLKLCLESLYRDTPQGIISETVIVDDGSSEEELSFVSQLINEYPHVTLIKNINPHGFAAACNTGAALATSPYILFLNSDCLVAPNTITTLINACKLDSSIGCACPISNNAANLSLPMPYGFSYLEVDDILHKAALKLPPEDQFVEACTIVGHCLLVTRSCFLAVGGFDTSWGLGYGEETEFQLRARGLKYRGVAVTNSYAYHFGGGTFRYESQADALRDLNHKRFISTWGEAYENLAKSCEAQDPVKIADKRLSVASAISITPDVLFVLPGFKSAVGGIMVIVDICNYLILNGVNAKAIILGEVPPNYLSDYPEALLFSPLHVDTEADLLKMASGLRPKVIFGTLFTTSFPAARFAKLVGAQYLNFVQGYEFYFSNGIHYNEVRESYQLSSKALTTSSWLAEGIKRHTPNTDIFKIPLGIDPSAFFPRSNYLEPRQKIRVGIVLRSNPDKGQWVLAEVIDRLSSLNSKISLSVFAPSDLPLPINETWANAKDTVHVKLPIDRCHLGKFLRDCDILIDASLHEGYGLLPLEAFACGCTTIASDSGGIREFIEHQKNGIIINKVTQPEEYITAVQELISKPDFLRMLKHNALHTAENYYQDDCFARYKNFIISLIEGSAKNINEFLYTNKSNETYSDIVGYTGFQK